MFSSLNDGMSGVEEEMKDMKENKSNVQFTSPDLPGIF